MVDAGDARTTTDISTAAQLLGLSVEALRKRLQRGRMEGFKAADGSWRVVLDAIDEQSGGLGNPLAGGLAATRGNDPNIDVLLREIRHLGLNLQTLTDEIRSLEEAVRTAGLVSPVSGSMAGRATKREMGLETDLEIDGEDLASWAGSAGAHGDGVGSDGLDNDHLGRDGAGGDGADRTEVTHDANLHAVKQVLLEVLAFLQRKSG